jgi:DNA replication and repair protein RecF
MRLADLELLHFRNIRAERFAPGPGINVLWGDNAQGKTSVLEAIYVLARGHSFRCPKVNDVISYEQSAAIVRGTVLSDRQAKELGVEITPRSKTFVLNGKRQPLGRYLGHLVVFLSSVERMEIIRGEPEQRRRFLDDGIATVDPGYATILERYHRILKNKNRLLKRASESAPPESYADELEAWNQQLVEVGTVIHDKRVRYVEHINRVLEGRLFGEEEITLRYVSSLQAQGDAPYKELFAQRLELRRAAELAVGYALVGPHRDDLEIKFNGRDLRHYGSLGQQRSALIILDLAQMTVYNKAFDESAIFLIDDVDAELDHRRIERLLKRLDGPGQSFLTTSRRGWVDRTTRSHHLFRLEAGRLYPELETASLTTRDV